MLNFGFARLCCLTLLILSWTGSAQFVSPAAFSTVQFGSNCTIRFGVAPEVSSITIRLLWIRENNGTLNRTDMGRVLSATYVNITNTTTWPQDYFWIVPAKGQAITVGAPQSIFTGVFRFEAILTFPNATFNENMTSQLFFLVETPPFVAIDNRPDPFYLAITNPNPYPVRWATGGLPVQSVSLELFPVPEIPIPLKTLMTSTNSTNGTYMMYANNIGTSNGGLYLRLTIHVKGLTLFPLRINSIAFAINTAPAFTVTSPLITTAWQPHTGPSSFQISWTPVGLLGFVDIGLEWQSGFYTFATTVPNPPASYSWSRSELQNIWSMIGGCTPHARVRVMYQYAPLVTAYSPYFTLCDASFAVTAPTPGGFVLQSSPYDIKWTPSGVLAGDVKIFLSDLNTTDRVTLYNSVPNDGFERWDQQSSFRPASNTTIINLQYISARTGVLTDLVASVVCTFLPTAVTRIITDPAMYQGIQSFISWEAFWTGGRATIDLLDGLGAKQRTLATNVPNPATGRPGVASVAIDQGVDLGSGYKLRVTVADGNSPGPIFGISPSFSLATIGVTVTVLPEVVDLRLGTPYTISVVSGVNGVGVTATIELWAFGSLIHVVAQGAGPDFVFTPSIKDACFECSLRVVLVAPSRGLVQPLTNTSRVFSIHAQEYTPIVLPNSTYVFGYAYQLKWEAGYENVNVFLRKSGVKQTTLVAQGDWYNNIYEWRPLPAETLPVGLDYQVCVEPITINPNLTEICSATVAVLSEPWQFRAPNESFVWARGIPFEVKWNPAGMDSMTTDLRFYEGPSPAASFNALPNNGSFIFDFAPGPDRSDASFSVRLLDGANPLQARSEYFQLVTAKLYVPSVAGELSPDDNYALEWVFVPELFPFPKCDVFMFPPNTLVASGVTNGTAFSIPDADADKGYYFQVRCGSLSASSPEFELTKVPVGLIVGLSILAVVLVAGAGYCYYKRKQLGLQKAFDSMRNAIPMTRVKSNSTTESSPPSGDNSRSHSRAPSNVVLTMPTEGMPRSSSQDPIRIDSNAPVVSSPYAGMKNAEGYSTVSTNSPGEGGAPPLPAMPTNIPADPDIDPRTGKRRRKSWIATKLESIAEKRKSWKKTKLHVAVDTDLETGKTGEHKRANTGGSQAKSHHIAGRTAKPTTPTSHNRGPSAGTPSNAAPPPPTFTPEAGDPRQHTDGPWKWMVSKGEGYWFTETGFWFHPRTGKSMRGPPPNSPPHTPQSKDGHSSDVKDSKSSDGKQGDGKDKTASA